MSAEVERAANLARPGLTSRTRPITRFDPIAVFGAADVREERSLWFCPSSSEAMVGIGAAWTIATSGADRFQQVSAAWRHLLADALITGGSPRLIGGFSFDPARPATPLWNGFPSARFVLPHRLYSLSGDLARITTNVCADAASDTAPSRVRQLEHDLSADEWQALVGTVASGIRDGSLGATKVVLARAHTGRSTRSIEDALRSLAESYPTCTVFAFAHGDVCFLGATPERLIYLRDGLASTMALAGSYPRGASPGDDERLRTQLLNDEKERAEHAIVVGALRECLESMCTRVMADAEPRVRQLVNVQHLITPVRGQVQRGRTVLDLVERLHPTPAVGGFPRDRALELIRERESLDRGWYAAPIGWIDADGEGEFVVALRSALMRGTEATLFAGCGIVADSDPSTEYAEWGWKLRPMQAALGAELRT